jgi:hypothetical protein
MAAANGVVGIQTPHGRRCNVVEATDFVWLADVRLDGGVRIGR